MKMIGLIKLLGATAFEAYRRQVGATLAPYGGVVPGRDLLQGAL
jgi:hypothetical protein